jgi:hypothetical protein
MLESRHFDEKAWRNSQLCWRFNLKELRKVKEGKNKASETVESEHAFELNAGLNGFQCFQLTCLRLYYLD